jgi:hypothetical protein
MPKGVPAKDHPRLCAMTASDIQDRAFVIDSLATFALSRNPPILRMSGEIDPNGSNAVALVSITLRMG